MACPTILSQHTAVSSDTSAKLNSLVHFHDSFYLNIYKGIGLAIDFLVLPTESCGLQLPLNRDPLTSALTHIETAFRLLFVMLISDPTRP